ncbi:hypothetical protein Aduo_002326 [Ancylostoma duodenale]
MAFTFHKKPIKYAAQTLETLLDKYKSYSEGITPAGEEKKTPKLRSEQFILQKKRIKRKQRNVFSAETKITPQPIAEACPTLTPNEISSDRENYAGSVSPMTTAVSTAHGRIAHCVAVRTVKAYALQASKARLPTTTTGTVDPTIAINLSQGDLRITDSKDSDCATRTMRYRDQTIQIST